MKVVTTVVLILTWNFCHGQSMTTYDPGFESCEQAIKQAQTDADAGILRSISHGMLISTRSVDFNSFYQNYLIAKYRIESYDAGCIVMPHDECYSDEMNRIIAGKFGIDFFDRVEAEAENEFEKFKTLKNEERKRYIDFSYVYSHTDTRSEYAKGYKELNKEIRRRIDFSTLDFSPYPFKGIVVHLVIGQKGDVEKCRVSSINFPRTIATRIEREIMDIGNWTPATLYGHAVTSEATLTLLLKD